MGRNKKKNEVEFWAGERSEIKCETWLAGLGKVLQDLNMTLLAFFFRNKE